MNAGADTEEGASAIPLLNAVFCVDCETISNSPFTVGLALLLPLPQHSDRRGARCREAERNSAAARHRTWISVAALFVLEIPGEGRRHVD